MTQLSDVDVARYAYNAGQRGEDLITATAIAFRESGGKTDAVNINTDIYHSHDVGLWQVNLHYWPQYTYEQMIDPTQNANAMFHIYTVNHGFSAWRYPSLALDPKLVERAKAAVQQLGEPTTGGNGWLDELKALVQGIIKTMNEQIAKPTSERIPWATEEPKLEKLIDDFISGHTDLPAAATTILTGLKNSLHNAANYGEGVKATGEVIGPIEGLANDISNWISDQTEKLTGLLGTVGATVAVVIVGMFLIIIGAMGIAGRNVSPTDLAMRVTPQGRALGFARKGARTIFTGSG